MTMSIENARSHLMVILPMFDETTQDAIKTLLAIDKSDLTINQVDENHFEFNGHIYYKRKNNYCSRVEWLHIAIYEANYNLIVPKGYEIHHKDFDNKNNNIENLQMLTKAEHMAIHIKALNSKSGSGICTACGKQFKSNNLFMRFCSNECAQFTNRHKLKGHFNDDGSFKIEYLQSKGGKHMLTCGELARQYVKLHPTLNFELKE